MALDPAYFFYSDGTISLTNGSDIATGQFVAWDPAVLPFDFVYPNDGTAGITVIKEVLGVNQIRLAKPWAGPTLTNVPYFMVRWANHIDPRFYAVRVSEYLARLKAIPDNIVEVGQQIAADRAAVDAAVVTLGQIQAAVDADQQAIAADRQAAQEARTGAETAYNSFRNVNYGPLEADPATRPDGSPIQEGDVYTRTTAPKGQRIFLDGVWTTAVIEANGALLKANNLSDLPNKEAALGNLTYKGRPLNQVLQSYSWITDYGDLSSTDAAITDATFAAALAASKYIKVPPGRFVTSAQIFVGNTLDNQKIEGCGMSLTTIAQQTAATPVFRLKTGRTGLTVCQMRITRDVPASNTGHGIFQPDLLSFAELSDLLIDAQYFGVSLGPTDYSRFRQIILQRNLSHGYFATNNATHGSLQWYMEDVLAQMNGGDGFRISSNTQGAAKVSLGDMKGLRTFANSGSGLRLEAVSAACPIHGLRLFAPFFGEDGGSEIVLNTFGGIHRIEGGMVEIGGTRTTGPLVGPPGAGAAATRTSTGLYITANNQDVTVIGTEFANNSYNGIFTAAERSQFFGVICTNNGNALVAGNRYGIHHAGGLLLINGGRAGNKAGVTNQDVGVFSYDGTKATIIGVDMTGNATTAFQATTGGNRAIILGCPGANNQLPGLAIGAPTGGYIATTLNVEGDVRKNNTVYANP